MFVPVACSQCGKPFQVPDAALGKTTACPWCQASVLALPISGESPASISHGTSTESAGGNSNTPLGVERQRETPPLPDDTEPSPSPELLSLDDEPTPQDTERLQPAPKKSLLRRVIWVVIGLFLMMATTAITLAILQHKKGYMVSMEWRGFTPPDGSCGIDLPGQATEADSDPEHGERRYVSQGWYSGTTAWIGWRTLTPAQIQEGTTKDGWLQYRKLFFDKERDRLKDKFGGYIAKDATTEYDPVTVEVRLDGQQGPAIERMIVMPKGPRPRVYFIGMAGKRLNLDGTEVKRLFDSFRVYD
jgi:hypothetical protein